MKIIVLGGRGQLGRSLERVAREYDWADVKFTDLPESDICDIESVERALEGADVAINCAAWTAVDTAETYPDEAERINRDGARIVAKAAQKLGVALVFISTDYVFDGFHREPIEENIEPAPLNVYGMTKLAGEQAVAESGARAVIVRTSWLYSEFGNNFVRTMLRIGGERDEVRVVNDQWGSPTYAVDLARAIMWIIERGIDAGCEIYHYCNDGITTWYDFAQAIFREADENVSIVPVTTAEYPTLACRPEYSALSTDKLKRLGVTIPSWEDALKRCLMAIRMQD